MADTTITGLLAAGALTGTEPLPIVQAGSTVKATTQAIANLGKTVSAASVLLGRGSAGGAGAQQEIALGTGLTMSGTTLAVTTGLYGNAQTANPLSQFAATTSAQLAGVLTDETGSGGAVFATGPTLVNPVVGTQAPGNNTTLAASTAFVTAAVSGGAAGGANKQVQYNNSGAFGATAGFEYDSATNILTVQKITASGLVTTAAATTGTAGLNLPHGTAPTAPVNGDLWSTTAGFFGRVNGSTVGPFGAGGGGLTNWTEALKTAAPYSTTNAASSFVATNATATNIAAVLSPKGSGPVQAQVADTTAAGGNIRGANSVDWQTMRASASQVAGGVQAVLAGGINNQVGGTNCVVGGGTTNIASANNSTIAGGSTNTASNDSATVGGGATNTASQVFTTIAGGNTNTASVRGASIGGGESNQASGNNSAIPGGKANFADAIYSFAMGDTSRTRGLYAVDAWCPGNTAYASKVQSLGMRLLEQTTTATPKVLTADQSGSPSNTNQYGLNPSMLCCVIGKVTGRTAAGVTSAWTFTAAIKQQTNNAGTALVGTPTVTLVGQDAGASTWGAPTITADVTNGAMAITVTGVAATTINWVATIDAAENTF